MSVAQTVRTKNPTKKKWSGKVTKESHALDLENRVFTRRPKEIEKSLKRSAEDSHNRKSSPFRSAMSMLNFYINRAGQKLIPSKRKKLNQAKDELRRLFHKPVSS